MYAYPLPAEHAFTVEGQALFPVGRNDNWDVLLLANSRVFAAVVNRFTAQHKYHGYLNSIYVRDLELSDLAPRAERIVELLREIDTSNEISPVFTVASGDRRLGLRASLADQARLSIRASEANRLREEADEEIERRLGASVDRSESPPYDVNYLEAFFNESAADEVQLRVANLLMWCVGVAFGRWDIRMAHDASLIPALQGPFERLPRVAPGGLVGPDGLPATPDRIASEAWLRARPDAITLPEPGSFEGPESVTAAEYPIEVAWDGILVDDPGHPRDILAKVREVLAYVYGGTERAREIEEEALGILQAGARTPRTLRDWFRTQKATELGKTFFDFHIQRYSKSRRKAPIYWRLTSNPGRGQADYSVWLYYHRLTGDTLWQVLTRYVGPKRELEARRLEDLRRSRESAGGGERSRIEKEIEGKLQLLEELDWFEARLRALAERGYAPDLDDGVIINLAPLHELVPWKEPEQVWKKLEKGDYDWARLAMKYWPDRVREKCREDRSLAIAHGMER
ncbi:MAG: hypothetical protein IRZ00_01035 [Gemmatimonadetes bacterium]|nr:hypothetical protein [Gemmatimonadota bacterium]